ncbi:MFS transporter [Microterricola viridarii]|uniref:Major facilitator superfamily (MFS) profile domain-containing protein n=1 Tax=Microterricola viridarii TaxID=412690 RepID=A0A0Y0NEW7_9MICO|nr:MFS transporter [Microterricola viridarii]AMB59776.1 hypothetical protein AWU67_13925 [Microterricola viridarii]
MTAPSTTELLEHTPSMRVSRGWITKLSLAFLGINIVWAGPGQVLLAPQIERLTALDAGGLFSSNKESNLAVVAFATALFSLIAVPLWGALSDRTRSRWGRRTPWMALGTLGAAAGLVATGFASSLGMLAVAWVLTQVFMNAVITPISAAVPDQVPVPQRGVVSGWMGFTYTFAIVLGTAIGTVATAVWSGAFGITMGYVLCAAVCVLAMLPFLLTRWEKPSVDRMLEAFRLKDFLACYWVNVRKHPDFGWAWITRFFVSLSSALALFYLYYYLQDSVGLTRDDAAGDGGLRVSDGVLLLTAVYAFSVFATVVVAGVLSDRVGKRRVFVSASAVFTAIGVLIMAFSPEFPVVVVAAIILGLGTGVFTAVDFALVTEVLPSSASNGKDIGIIGLAVNLPNMLAPILAAFMVTAFAGYSALYVLAAVLAILGGVLVFRIRGVA